MFNDAEIFAIGTLVFVLAGAFFIIIITNKWRKK